VIENRKIHQKLLDTTCQITSTLSERADWKEAYLPNAFGGPSRGVLKVDAEISELFEKSSEASNNRIEPNRGEKRLASTQVGCRATSYDRRRATKKILTGAACLLLLFVGRASADDWPQFRGPTAQGTSTATGLPVEWSAAENVAWKVPIPGKGWSSPVLVKGAIYLTAAVPVEEKDAAGKPKKKISRTLHAIRLDATTGKIVWNVEVFKQDGITAPRIHGKNSHASPTPIVDGDRLYVHFGHQGTACLDLSGKVIWTNREIKYPPVHGNGGSPALVDGALVFSCDGAKDPFVIALEASSGKVRWKTPRVCDAGKKFAFCTPLVISVAEKSQVILPGVDAVVAYDPASGAEMWRVSYTGYSVVPRPVFAHGLLFISTSFDSPSVMAIRPDGSGDVTKTHVAWKMKKGAPHTPSMLVVGEALYMVSDRGVATCVDAKTGKVHWQERLGGNYSSSLVYADGRIYFQSEKGKGTVVEASTTYRKLATNDLKERTLASYAVGDGALFIRSDKHLYRIGKR
jgi:outer membrane protein assembly factor BamB